MPHNTPDTHYVPRSRKKGLIAMAALFAGLVVVSLVFSGLDLDRRISGLFYHPQEGFFLENHAPWIWLYRYGTIPGIVFITLGIIAFFMSTISTKWMDIKRPAAIVVLSALLGSGILANVILKPYWGRPRPSQVTEFGGEWRYRDAISPGIPGKGQSFPSGHCTIAFLFTSAWFGRRKYPKSAASITVLGIVYGLFMSAARVVQGAHFATDAIWGFGVMALAAQFWDVVLPDPMGTEDTPAGRIRPIPLLAAVSALSILGVDFAAHRPFFEHHRRFVYLEPDTKKILITANVPLSRTLVVRQADGRPRILFDSQGFGFYNARRSLTDSRKVKGDELIQQYRIETSGRFSELNHSVKVVLPASVSEDIRVVFESPQQDEP